MANSGMSTMYGNYVWLLEHSDNVAGNIFGHN